MTPVFFSTLANLGAGALLGWLALPLFARLTALRFVHEPSSSHRALLWALGLAALLMLVPWARGPLPHAQAPTLDLPTVPSETAPFVVTESSFSVLGFYFLCIAGLAWLAAAALASALMLVTVAQLAALLRRARPAPADLARAISQSAAPGVERIRRILLSEEASVPFVAVPWRPVLVIPATFRETFDDEALALMIEHESAHLQRGDLWTSALVRGLGVLFPFHPTAARLANDLAFAREASVDARVAPRDPHAYARVLLDVAAHARFDQLPKPVSMDDTALGRRIAMLTDRSSPKRARSVGPVMVSAMIMATASLLVPSVFGAPANAPPRRARHTPESSYVACQGKDEGDECPFPTPDGELKGRCRSNRDNGRLFCEPPPPPDAPPGESGPTSQGRVP